MVRKAVSLLRGTRCQPADLGGTLLQARASCSAVWGQYIPQRPRDGSGPCIALLLVSHDLPHQWAFKSSPNPVAETLEPGSHLREGGALNCHAGGTQPALPHQLPQLHRAVGGGQPAIGHALQHLQQLRVDGCRHAIACAAAARRREGWCACSTDKRAAAGAPASQPWPEE